MGIFFHKEINQVVNLILLSPNKWLSSVVGKSFGSQGIITDLDPHKLSQVCLKSWHDLSVSCSNKQYILHLSSRIIHSNAKCIHNKLNSHHSVAA